MAAYAILPRDPMQGGYRLLDLGFDPTDPTGPMRSEVYRQDKEAQDSAAAEPS